MKKEKENTALDEEKKMEILLIYTYKTEQQLLNIFIIYREIKKLVKHDINESARHICRI